MTSILNPWCCGITGGNADQEVFISSCERGQPFGDQQDLERRCPDFLSLLVALNTPLPFPAFPRFRAAGFTLIWRGIASLRMVVRVVRASRAVRRANPCAMICRCHLPTSSAVMSASAQPPNFWSQVIHSQVPFLVDKTCGLRAANPREVFLPHQPVPANGRSQCRATSHCHLRTAVSSTCPQPERRVCTRYPHRGPPCDLAASTRTLQTVAIS
jgi:hypothetical protein